MVMVENWIVHNSHGSFFRQPFGAVPCNQKILLRLEITSKGPVESVILRLWKNEKEEKTTMQLESHDEKKSIYRAQIGAPSTPGLLWYFFIVNCNGNTYYYGNNPENWGGIGQVYTHEPPSYQITVYKEGTSTPHWFKEAVMYQIFVDRFYNGNAERKTLTPKKKCHIYADWDSVPFYRTDPETGKVVCYDFFGGNLLGVLKKLPYLKELGIDVVYLNPIFEATSNHKYDTADYKKVDPMYGNNQLFQKLCIKAKEMGISIILDGVFSHTGSDSIYFNKEGNYPELGAYQSKDSPYYPWYIFYEYPDKYDCWWGFDTLPNVNELEPSYQDFIINSEDSVLKYWMRMGAKGWRLDVVDELPDQFVKRFRQEMKKLDPHSILIGEVWEDASNKISYGKMRQYLLGEELDSVMNYPFRKILLDFILGRKDAGHTHQALMSLYENYPLEHFYATMNLIGSHDTPRILTLLGEAPPQHMLSREEKKCFRLTPEQRKLAIKRLKLLSLCKMTFPGVPCIYYGDEVGMEGYEDPFCRGPYPWGKEDHELLNWYKKIIFLRKKHDVLKTGRWIPLYARGDIYGYIRLIEKGRDAFQQIKKDNVAIVILNRNPQHQLALSIDVGQWCAGPLVDVLEDGREVHLQKGVLNLSLQPLTGRLLMKECIC